MVEVKLYLYTPDEVGLLAQFEAALRQMRAIVAKETAETLTPVAPQVAPEPHLASEPVVEMAAPADEPVIVVDDVTLFREVTEYAQKHGIPAVQEKLQAFGAAKAIEIPADRRAAFITSLD